MIEDNGMSMEAAANKQPAPQNQDALPVLSQGQDLHTILKNAEVQIKAQDNIVKMALNMTSKKHWVDQNGKPYLEYKGACKIARLFGVSVKNVMKERNDLKDDKGSYYMYTFTGDAEWNGVTTPEIGACTSRDKFFGQRGGQPLPESEVTVEHVMRKAHTNLMNRAIKNKLGLDFDWDEIEAATGGRISRSGSTSVSYDKGTKGGSTAPPKVTAAGNDKRREVWEWILEYVGGDVQAAQDTLVNMTQFKNNSGKMVGGRRNIKDVSDAALKVLHPRVKKEIESYRNSQEG